MITDPEWDMPAQGFARIHDPKAIRSNFGNPRTQKAEEAPEFDRRSAADRNRRWSDSPTWRFLFPPQREAGVGLACLSRDGLMCGSRLHPQPPFRGGEQVGQSSQRQVVTALAELGTTTLLLRTTPLRPLGARTDRSAKPPARGSAHASHTQSGTGSRAGPPRAALPLHSREEVRLSLPPRNDAIGHHCAIRKMLVEPRAEQRCHLMRQSHRNEERARRPALPRARSNALIRRSVIAGMTGAIDTYTPAHACIRELRTAASRRSGCGARSTVDATFDRAR